MPPSDGPDAEATIENARRSVANRPRPDGAPIVRAPIAREHSTTAPAEHSLRVLDGDGDDEPGALRTTIDPSTAATVGDFVAAMVAPAAAAVFAQSVAVFIGTALAVLLLRAQGRRSALTDAEIGAISPVAAATGALLLTYTVAPDAGLAHALTASVIALATGVLAALLVRTIIARRVHTRIAVLGDAQTAHELAWRLSATGQRRFTVVGYVTRTTERDNLRELSHVSFKIRRLGLLAGLSQIVARNDVDLLVMAASDDRMKYFERAAVCTERFQTRLISMSAFDELVFRRVPLDHLDVAWFQHIMHPRFRPAPRVITRGVDITFAITVGLLTAIVWAPVALLMRLLSGRPVLVTRRRVGERGRAIMLYNFRVARREANGAAPSEDAPPTGPGRLLRRTGIERLPLLINLLRGDLALVGPRPIHPQVLADREQTIPFYGRRRMLRPGITGWAQIHRSGSAEEEFSSDLFYLKQQSVMLYAYVLLAAFARSPRQPSARR
jgi:lipopolysaccharide/colanic/teichoic acid biosynthesis glycosyltransferase